MKNRIILIYLFLLILVPSCDIFQKDIQPEDGFLKIYNHPDESLEFYPQGVVETENRDFIILSGLKSDSAEAEFPTSYLISANPAGELNWSAQNDFRAPEGKLFVHGSDVRYIAMDEQLDGYMVEISAIDGQVTGQASLGVEMPLSSYEGSSGNIMVLSYDIVGMASNISLFGSNLSLVHSTNIDINKEMQNEVQKYLNKSGNDYPFFIGEYSDGSAGYYVNCFNNYTLRVVFFDGSGNRLSGDVYSYQTDAALSSFIQKYGNHYALTRYYAGNNYLIRDLTVETGVSQNVNNVDATSLFELTPDAKVLTLRMKKDNDESLLFASQTNANALVIYEYALDSTGLVNTYMQDFNNRIEVSDMIQTADKGILVLGRVFVLGKFPRPFLFKMPYREFVNEG
jgi:hypothetical protein